MLLIYRKDALLNMGLYQKMIPHQSAKKTPTWADYKLKSYCIKRKELVVVVWGSALAGIIKKNRRFVLEVKSYRLNYSSVFRYCDRKKILKLCFKHDNE